MTEKKNQETNRHGESGTTPNETEERKPSETSFRLFGAGERKMGYPSYSWGGDPASERIRSTSTLENFEKSVKRLQSKRLRPEEAPGRA